MTNEELNAIRERAEASTPGPWYVSCSSVKTKHPDHQALSQWYNGTNNEVCSLSDGGEYIDNINGDNDAEFIAHAREDVPKLLAEIERLKQALKVADAWWNYHAKAHADLFDRFIRKEGESR